MRHWYLTCFSIISLTNGCATGTVTDGLGGDPSSEGLTGGSSSGGTQTGGASSSGGLSSSGGSSSAGGSASGGASSGGTSSGGSSSGGSSSGGTSSGGSSSGGASSGGSSSGGAGTGGSSGSCSPTVASRSSAECGSTWIYNGKLYLCASSNLGNGCGTVGVFCQNVDPDNVPWGDEAWTYQMDCD